MSYSILAHTIAGSADTNNVTTPGIDTTGANLIIIGLADDINTSPTISAISDSKGNTWTQIRKIDDGLNVRAALFYSFGSNLTSVGAGHTFTATSTGAFPAIAVLALQTATISPLDQQNSGFNAATGSTATNSVTPTLSNEILVTVAGTLISNSLSIDSGFTISDQNQLVGGHHLGVGLAYLIETTNIAKNPIWTCGAAGEICVVIATFTTPISSFMSLMGA